MKIFNILIIFVLFDIRFFFNCIKICIWKVGNYNVKFFGKIRVKNFSVIFCNNDIIKIKL